MRQTEHGLHIVKLIDDTDPCLPPPNRDFGAICPAVCGGVCAAAGAATG